ncbi:hypothetical protein Tco_0005018 [Tanacetum coccineum]
MRVGGNRDTSPSEREDEKTSLDSEKSRRADDVFRVLLRQSISYLSSGNARLMRLRWLVLWLIQSIAHPGPGEPVRGVSVNTKFFGHVIVCLIEWARRLEYRDGLYELSRHKAPLECEPNLCSGLGCGTGSVVVGVRCCDHDFWRLDSLGLESLFEL